MTPNHAACGLIVGFATLDHTGLTSPWQRVAYVTVWAGLAVIADWDHHGSRPTTMWGSASELLTTPLRALPGGHRWATHDLVLAPVSGFAITWALLNVPGDIITLLTHIAHSLNAPTWSDAVIRFAVTLLPLALIIGVTLKMTVLPKSRSALLNLACSLAGSWWFTHHPANDLARLLPWIVAGGLIVHALGDLPTDEGLPVPILWLVTRARFALGLFEVNGPFERLVLTPVLGLCVCWLSWQHVPPQIQSDVLTLLSAAIPAAAQR